MTSQTSPRFEPAGRVRPIDVLGASVVELDLADAGASSHTALPQPAPSTAVIAERPAGDATLALTSGATRLAVELAGGRVGLALTHEGRTTVHRSRRYARVGGPVDALALTLTGAHLSALTRTGRDWTVRARVDLRDRLDRLTHDDTWLAALAVDHEGEVARLRAGGFGQLGLRDLRLATYADGTAYLHDGLPVLTATSAGPGFFDTAHTSVWTLDPERLALTHRSDLFFRRPDRPGVYADHATHLVRDGETWLVATSTWGDFDPGEADASVAVTLAEVPGTTDLLTGRHVLTTEPLALPTDGLTSVGVWDPHLVRTDTGWLVGYVSARKFFAFHPVVAEGPRLDALRLRAAAAGRRATEGTTLARLPASGPWRVLASDGRDGHRGQQAAYPVFDLDLAQVGRLDAPYPSNIPWPTLVPTARGLLLVGFDGEPTGGALPGYGTHGAVVFAREVTGDARVVPAGRPPIA